MEIKNVEEYQNFYIPGGKDQISFFSTYRVLLCYQHQ